MKKTTVILGVTLCAMLLVLGVAYANKKSSTFTNTTPTPVSTTTVSTSTNPTPTTLGYTLAVVAAHNSASSCWTAINGNVYDVTTWINQHPGGPQAILSLCGTDGSAAFNGQHGGERRPASELASFRIGALTN